MINTSRSAAIEDESQVKIDDFQLMDYKKVISLNNSEKNSLEEIECEPPEDD